MKIIVTGGCGFIGSNFIHRVLKTTDFEIFNIDKLTYAGTTTNHKEFLYKPKYNFEKIDICNMEKVLKVFRKFKPDAIVHLAAESHVDRSIENSNEFIGSNIIGTHSLLEVTKQYCKEFNNFDSFKFLYVNSEEVFGSLRPNDPPFTEMSPYRANSPYAASKAAGEMMVRAWYKTYGIPSLITHSTNTYGKQQLTEKLIPKTIFRAFDRKIIPVYGDGSNVRDWIHVDDHCDALFLVLTKGRVGESYGIGADNAWSNLNLVYEICEIVDKVTYNKEPSSHPRRELVQFVLDRPGHDKRYAIDSSKIKNELGWEPKIDFSKGLEETVSWYLGHRDWWL